MYIAHSLAERACNIALGRNYGQEFQQHLLQWHRHSRRERAVLDDDAYFAAQRLIAMVNEGAGEGIDLSKTMIPSNPFLRER